MQISFYQEEYKKKFAKLFFKIQIFFRVIILTLYRTADIEQKKI